ncbi:MAG: hypothetical protein GY913_07120 [Proteobacteria bacterium]|nr:hypothetical protein [Pseudomonadota bacterium]MCP4916679.1 hypothetical protein [Pseudomonadota bacterium]
MWSVVPGANADTGFTCPGTDFPEATYVDGVCVADLTESRSLDEVAAELPTYACEVGSDHRYVATGWEDWYGRVYQFDEEGQLVGKTWHTSEELAWCCDGQVVQQVTWGELPGLCTVPIPLRPSGTPECAQTEAQTKVQMSPRNGVGFAFAFAALGALGLMGKTRW